MRSRSTSELNRIEPILEGIIKAISSIINVDITIIDHNLKRIVSTGTHIEKFGDYIDANSVFAYVLKSGEELIIDNPRSHYACKECFYKATCKEYAEVCCPIVVEGKVLGAIGLIAFDERQQSEIMDNKKNLLAFLKRMSELIGIKINEERHRDKLAIQSKEMDVLINYVDKSVISVDEEGNLLRYNNLADEMFSLEKRGIKQIAEIVKGMDMDTIHSVLEADRSYEFDYSGPHGEKRYIFTVRPIEYHGRIGELVLSFNEVKDLIDNLHNVMGHDMVTRFDDIIGDNEQFVKTKKFAKKSSNTVSTILITGESGTGKELFARAVHFESVRRNGPFIPINCSAIPENLLESELFGYEEGAFTGASKGGKMGKFQLADGGTLFLDEIGDMPLHLQAKLLRVLQEKRIEPVGGKRSIPIDVRVISATHRDLETMIRDGEFREDLYYRLNVIPITIPPLRERKDDLGMLVDFFTRKFSQKLDKDVRLVDKEVINILDNYQWKGNVRELENVMEYSVNMCAGDRISKEDLPPKLLNQTKDKCPDMEIRKIKDLEKMEIERALERYGRDTAGIKAILQATGLSRATLYRKIKEYDL